VSSHQFSLHRKKQIAELARIVVTDPATVPDLTRA
jgi:hypothetical protein